MAEIEKVKLPNDDTIYDIKDAKAIRGLASGTTSGHVLQFGADGYTVGDSGKSMSDKQDTIDSSHKLSSDLVDDSTATNKFTNATEKAKVGRIIMDSTETQDYYMQDSTPSSPSEGDYWFTDEPIVSADVSAMTGYTKAQSASAIATTDTLNEAIGKVEKKADDNTTGLSSKQNEVLGSWTAGTATTHQTPTGTDTVLQALQKIDNNQRNDENNILSEQQKTSSMGTAGTGYIVVNSVRIYVGATEPTGEIPEGSLWLNSAVI